jgi:hypothetical protein
MLLIKKYLQKHLNKNFIETSITLYVFLIFLSKNQTMNFDFA